VSIFNVCNPTIGSQSPSFGSSLGTCSATLFPNMNMSNSIFGQSGLGVYADSVPHVSIVSPSIGRDIISGKNINLAALLIPGYNFEV
jgi:hypothetical protein